MSARILVVEDHAETRGLIRDSLSSAGYRVREAENGHDAIVSLATHPADAIVSDFRMDPINGLELLREIRKTMNVPFILYSAGADTDTIFRAGREGAFVFLEYPFRIEDQLVPTIEASLASRRGSPEPAREGCARLVGSSVAMHRVRVVIDRVAASPANVLITGETGTGKELAALALHEGSGRSPLVSLSVTELSESLLEAELFGHEKGAFTGAVGSRLGLFGQADGGTLFLDEIGDASPRLQAKILRILETGQVRPVGGGSPEGVDVRVIAATHRDLGKRVRQGRFREDLLYRIRQTEIRIPPLRERLEDLDETVKVLLTGMAVEIKVAVPRIDASFMQGLRNHSWPGNVRELRNILQNVLLWWDGHSSLEGANLLDALPVLDPGHTPEEQADRDRMIEAYRCCKGNQEAARRELGLSRGEWRHRWGRFGLDILGRRRS